MIGSAYRNKGIQPLLDAVNRYLPSPLDREVFAKDHAQSAGPRCRWRRTPMRRSWPWLSSSSKSRSGR